MRKSLFPTPPSSRSPPDGRPALLYAAFACVFSACTPISDPNPAGVIAAGSQAPGGSGAAGEDAFGGSGGGGNNPNGGSFGGGTTLSPLVGTWALCRASSESLGNIRAASEREEYEFTAGGRLSVTTTRFEQASCAAASPIDKETQILGYAQGPATANGAFELDLDFRSVSVAALSPRAAAEMSRLQRYGIPQWSTNSTGIDVTGRGETAGAAPRVTPGLRVYSLVRVNSPILALGVGTVESGITYDGSSPTKRFRALGEEQFQKALR